MDGYTVEEAASVLGIPRERVWELLARGILSGATDLAGGMRVRLKADPPAPPDPSPAHPERAGNGGHGGDATPFRELLTEFRSLTERYGQALLALGEARGEVATLRSRVDGLEARIDLRLPPASAPAASWRSEPWPIPSERVVEQPPSGPGHAVEVAEQREEDEPRHRRRARSGRRATESFAEALARAEDPSVPELPGAAEAAAALAALNAEQVAGGFPTSDADIALPRDLPSAEAVPVAEEPEPVATEPEPVAAEPEPVAAEPEPVAAQPEPVAAQPAQATADAGAGESADAASWDHRRYTATVDEPDWIAVDEVAPQAPSPPELEEGLAALDALANAPSSTAPIEPATGAGGEVGAETVPDTEAGGVAPTAAIQEPPADEPQAAPRVEELPPAPPSRPAESRRPTPEPAWTWSPPAVRPTPPPPILPRSPATRAYRRLRRIFPQ